eukprot:5147259-Pleurochrysis_carterae.AAC.1
MVLSGEATAVAVASAIQVGVTNALMVLSGSALMVSFGLSSTGVAVATAVTLAVLLLQATL